MRILIDRGLLCTRRAIPSPSQVLPYVYITSKEARIVIEFTSYSVCVYIDLGERDSLTSSVSEEENSDTMKTSEEVDFEKEFRPDDVGKEKNRTPEDT